MKKTLLVVHHTPSPYMREMFEAVLKGDTDPEIEAVDVVRRPARLPIGGLWDRLRLRHGTVRRLELREGIRRRDKERGLRHHR
jgi:hypothetical protein